MAFTPPPFERIEYRTPNAFHGTVRKDAESIWKEKKFRIPSTDPNNSRFGPGVYFWENSPQAAKNWVRVYYRSDDWCIIRAELGPRSVPLLTYTIEEVAQALGVSPTSIGRFEKRGLLHPIRGLRHKRFSRKEVDRFLAAETQPSY